MAYGTPDWSADPTIGLRAMGGPPPIEAPTDSVYEPPLQIPSQPGAFGISGDWLDNLAAALSNVQFMPPRNFGSGLATGFAQGFVGARGRQMAQQQALQQQQNQYAAQRNEANLKATAAAQALRAHQLQKKQDEADALVNEPKLAAAKEQAVLDVQKKMLAGPYKPDTSAGQGDDMQAGIDSAVQGIMNGQIPPDISTIGRNAKINLGIMRGLQQKGYDLKTAKLDWQAAQGWTRNANGAQQTRMRQALGTANQSLDEIDRLSAAWTDTGKRTKVPTLNKASLTLAVQGAYGPEPQKVATQLQAQISDVVSELSNAYMGGNSPTDHAMQLAAKNLSADWSATQLKAATDLARKNIGYRLNSMASIGPVTPGQQQPMPAPVKSQYQQFIGP